MQLCWPSIIVMFTTEKVRASTCRCLSRYSHCLDHCLRNTRQEKSVRVRETGPAILDPAVVTGLQMGNGSPLAHRRQRWQNAFSKRTDLANYSLIQNSPRTKTECEMRSNWTRRFALPLVPEP